MELERPEIRCLKCNRRPKDLASMLASVAYFRPRMDPDDFVWTLDSTINQATGKFACDECYVSMGFPTGDERFWQAEGAT
jgi:hypothetical protein